MQCYVDFDKRFEMKSDMPALSNHTMHARCQVFSLISPKLLIEQYDIISSKLLIEQYDIQSSVKELFLSTSVTIAGSFSPHWMDTSSYL